MKIKNKILLLQSFMLLIVIVFFALIFIFSLSRTKNVIQLGSIALNLNIDISRYKDFEKYFENSVVYFKTGRINDFRTSLVKGLYEIQLFEQSLMRYDDYPGIQDFYEIRRLTKDIKDNYYNVEKLFIAHAKDDITFNEFVSALEVEIDKIYDIVKIFHIKMNAFYSDSRSNMSSFITEIDRISRKGLMYIVVIMVLIFCVVLVITYEFASNITKPLLNLVNVMKFVEKDDYERPVVIPDSDDEVSYLTRSFKKMIKILKNRDIELKINNQNLLYQRNVAELSNKKLEELNKIKSEYLSNMGHELKTPLNSILGYADIIKEDWYEKFDVESKKDLDLIIEQANALYNIILLIMEISKLETGKVPVALEYFNVEEIISSCYNTLINDISSKNLKFEFKIDDVVKNIKSDPEKFRRILLNLISNSIKFTDKGKIKIFVKKANKQDYKKYLLLAEKKYLKLVVYDTGIGIPETKKSKVFEEFYQAHSDRSDKGSGLGLAIVKKLVDLLKGQIHIYSRVNKYTSMYVLLQYKEG